MCQLDEIVQTQEREDERSHRMFWKGRTAQLTIVFRYI